MTKTNRSIAEDALRSFEATVEFYLDHLRRCEPDDELQWRDRLRTAARVVVAIEAYINTLNKRSRNNANDQNL